MIILPLESRFNPQDLSEVHDWEEINLNFDSRVLITPRCHVWLGSCKTNGAGVFYVNGRGLRVSARKFAMERHLGRYLAPTDRVRSVCGDSSCVRIDHLEIAPKTSRRKIRGKAFVPPVR